MKKFIILKDSVKSIKRFNLQGRSVEFKLNPVPNNVEPIAWVKNAITDVILHASANLKPHDQVGFSFCSKEFNRGEGWIDFQEARNLSIDKVWEMIQGVYQSNSTGFDTDTFCLKVTSVRIPKGMGKRSGDVSFDVECARRKGIIVIKNTDNMCLSRALVVAMSKIENDPDFKNIISNNGELQTKMALKLNGEAGVTIPEEGCGIQQIQKFQDYLKDYKITVYSYGFKGREVIFEGPPAEKKLNVLLHEDHYNVITSLTAAFCCGYYCEECHVPYNNKNDHRCGGRCPACQQSPVCQFETKIKCFDCLRIFRNKLCYDKHKKTNSYDKKNSVCSALRSCPDCLKLFKSNREHICGEIFCKICKKHQPGDHLCHMQVDKGAPNLQDTLFVFFDFETRQEKVLADGSRLHEVNLCVFKQFCDICRETEPWLCEKCGVTTQILQLNPLDRFVEYLLNQKSLFKNVIVISHNGGGFDNQFILNKLITQTDLTPELIMRGTNIILMQLSNIKFIDSLNYFPMALNKFQKTFGLSDNFKKGYFPHLFNTIENENYIGSLPAIEYYSPDTMKTEERENFLKWYHEQISNNEIFNFKQELIEYCKSDTAILFESCKLFQDQMIATTNVCPFSEATTIASTCNKVFRRNFLKPNSIGIIPKNGYRLRDNQSKIALQWLAWEERVRGIKIESAGNGREVVIKGVKVDGYIPETIVFQFHGCYFRSCPKCFKYQRDEPLHDNPAETLNSRYESTIAQTERLRGFGYEVIEKWECEFRREMKENSEIEIFTKNHPILSITPLNPRDAFYGGRTGNTKTYYRVLEGEKIKYMDVCSLYPYVCKYGKFPVGHPEVFVGRDCDMLDLKSIDGLIKCKVLPPQDLYHPVLPVKMNKKLMFILCRSCGESMNYGECNHDENDRALEGTWVIEEVLKALQMGYQILDILEVWKYKVEKYDIANRTGGLFVEMMNTFIKIKQEASGWPSDCFTQEQRTQYIDDFLKNEGIQLELGAVAKNAGLRALAKLMLNSFWGKFGQLECQPKTKIIKKPEEFFSILTNPNLIVNSILPVNEETLLVNFQFTQDSYDSLSTVNVVIAAYVTAQARLKLYNYLEFLEKRVLYYDTDSVIYVSRPGDEDIQTGQSIGDMTNELEVYGLGSYIIHFASGGPKNYAYKVFLPTKQEERIVCKVKGICLNYATSKLVNFESIRDMIMNDDREPVQITSNQIRRTPLHEVITKPVTKTYKPVYSKRHFIDQYDSVPYGYKKARTN